MLVPDKKLVYSMYLASVRTTPADLPGGANITTDVSRRTAVVDYSGVVVISPASQNLVAVEGSVVSVYFASKCSSAAISIIFVAVLDVLFLCSRSSVRFCGSSVCWDLLQ